MVETPHSEEEARREQAARFFVGLLDDAPAAAREERDRWLRADPRNAVAYARIEAAWDRAGTVRAVPPPRDHDAHPPSDAPSGKSGCDQQ